MASSGEEGEGATQAPPKVRYCAVYDCLNNHKTHPDITYFGFPSDKERVKLWAEKIRRPDIVQPNGRVSSYYRVCETHFLPRHVKMNKSRRRLTRSAVPARRLPHPGSYVDVYELPGQAQPQVGAHFLPRHVKMNKSRRRLTRSAVPARRLPHPGSYVDVYELPGQAQPQVGAHFLPRHVKMNKSRRRLTRSAVPARRLPHPGSYVDVYELPGQAQPQVAAHFLPRHVKMNKSRRRLTRSAVPARRLPHPGSYVDVYELPGQAQQQVNSRRLVRSTLETFQYKPETPKPSKKRKKVEGARPTPPTPAPPALEKFFANCDSELPQDTAEFVKHVTRLQILHNSLDGCLNLLHLSPQVYHLLQASLGLPAVPALHRHCASRLLDLDTTLELFKTSVSRMTELEKHCTLSVDFIDTRPDLYYNITIDRIVGLHEVNGVQSPWVATRGVVIAVRGLLTNWTQPVALCYIARDDTAFNPWIDMIICHLYTMGLKVHALVCDPKAPLPTRDVSPEQPFFNLKDTKIYLIYDPPRLMKMLLCDFMTYDFHFEKTIAKWSDVHMYRKIERNKSLTLTPRLTDACIDPVAVKRMRPTRAARILSPSLAAALTDRADQGLLGESARATANFILKINNLYDLFSSTTTKGLEFKKGLSQDPSQIGFLTYMKSLFKSLKLQNGFDENEAETKKLSDIWQITIGAVLALRNEIQPLRPYLLTKQLHLDDSVSERVRRAARTTKPSCRELFVAFKMQFLHEMVQPPGKERKLELNGLLARVTSEESQKNSQLPMEIDEELRVQASDYRSFRLPKQQSLPAVAAHLLGAAARLHGDCELAAGYVRAPPEPDFLQLVKDLDEALMSALSEGASARSLLRDLLLDVHVLDCTLPCECFPLDYLKRLFFRLRLYHLLRHNQKRYKSGKFDLEIIRLN